MTAQNIAEALDKHCDGDDIEFSRLFDQIKLKESLMKLNTQLDSKKVGREGVLLKDDILEVSSEEDATTTTTIG